MSITKIAKLAGVSIATVSNALKGTGRVSPATAKKIKAIAKKRKLHRPRQKDRGATGDEAGDVRPCRS